MYSYHLYGLNIASEIEFEILTPSVDEADVTFRLGKINNKPIIDRHAILADWSTQQEVCIAYRNIGTFLIQHGREIIIEPNKNATIAEIGHLLLGMALSVILYQRDHLILHSSAVEIDAHAIGFLGHSGNGKSSLATALYEKGYKLVSDDLAVIDYISDEAILYSGFPQVKLWPDLIENIGIDPQGLPLITPKYTKRTRTITNRFIEKRYLPLGNLYILDQGDDITITELKGHEAIMELVGRSYDINLAELTGGLPKILTQCVQLAKHVSIKRLIRPWALDKMPDVIKAIEDDVYNNSI